MLRFVLVVALATGAYAAEPRYELSGRLAPRDRALVQVFGANVPFQATTESDDDGRFRFRNLKAGAYTIAVNFADRGEARKTVEVGPGTADIKRRVSLLLEFKDSDFSLKDAVRREHTVSTKQLTIPAKAMREYQAAQKDLERRDVDAAVKRLQHAIELAPQFADAWNNLGTIAYQTQKYERAERYFRAALQQDPKLYEPLVNLGGVLINNQKWDEALIYNQNAVLTRPNDALANSQLGLTYFLVGNLQLAVKYLEFARKLDPAHFSHPQLTLAEIHLRRGENGAAADALEDFLHRHPDYPTARTIREQIEKLRQ
jgi:tetratricopeptide (TPR) repeat protein